MLLKRILLSIPLFLACIVCGESQEVSRIEPPSWWTGMQHKEVQLLVHGNNIGSLTPKIAHKGVTILKTYPAESPNYLFIDLRIDDNASPGDVAIRFFNGSQEVASQIWKLNTRDADSAKRAGIDQSDVIYLITPDRYANGNPENDTVEGLLEKANRSRAGGRHGGDLAGVRAHQDDIAKMGFTTVWLNPVLENNMERGSYHGYSTTDYYKVDPRFGTNEEWRTLVDEGHALGLKHIMDVIPNHCGLNHWWMQDLPFEDWVNQWETYVQSNHRKTVSHDPYAAEVDKKQFTDGWFVPSMPDLNQRNPFLSTYLIQNAIWWVEYLGLSGLRVDTWPYSDPVFLTEYCKRILAEYPDLFIVGEQWHTMPATVAYWQKGKVNHDGYVSYLPNLMDFPVHSALVTALTTTGGWDDEWLPVYETLAQDILYPAPEDLLVFADNHDMSRIYTRVGENQALYRLALAYILTTRGIPQIFYGTEVLMSHPGTDEHILIRADYPGGWEGDSVNVFNGQHMSSDQKAAKDFCTRLLNWRKSHPAIHHGKLLHFAPQNHIYVYFRYDENEKIMVILNKNTENTTLDLSRFSEILDGVTQAKDAFTGQTVELGKFIELRGEGPIILELHTVRN